MARGGARGRAADPVRRPSTWASSLASKGKPLGSIADDDLVLKHTAGLRRADLFSRESRQALPSPTFAHSSARLYFGVWECK